MVVVHRARAVFVEVPRTGSEAIRRELLDRYGGTSVGVKHSLAVPTDLQSYRVVFGTSHPIDRMHSKYVKLKTRPVRYFCQHGNNAFVKYLSVLATLPSLIAVRWLGFSFRSYLWLFCPLPFVDPNNFIGGEGALTIRKEYLSEDFEQIFTSLGLQVDRKLPLVNATEGKGAIEYDLTSPGTQFRFNVELERQDYPFHPFDSRLRALWARVCYGLAFRIKRHLWLWARG